MIAWLMTLAEHGCVPPPTRIEPDGTRVVELPDGRTAFYSAEQCEIEKLKAQLLLNPGAPTSPEIEERVPLPGYRSDVDGALGIAVVPRRGKPTRDVVIRTLYRWNEGEHDYRFGKKQVRFSVAVLGGLISALQAVQSRVEAAEKEATPPPPPGPQLALFEVAEVSHGIPGGAA